MSVTIRAIPPPMNIAYPMILPTICPAAYAPPPFTENREPLAIPPSKAIAPSTNKIIPIIFFHLNSPPLLYFK